MTRRSYDFPEDSWAIEECHYKPITSAQSPNTDEEPQYEETDRRGCRLDWYAPILLLLSQNVNVKMRLNTFVFESKWGSILLYLSQYHSLQKYWQSTKVVSQLGAPFFCSHVSYRLNTKVFGCIEVSCTSKYKSIGSILQYGTYWYILVVNSRLLR